MCRTVLLAQVEAPDLPWRSEGLAIGRSAQGGRALRDEVEHPDCWVTEAYGQLEALIEVDPCSSLESV